MSFVPNDFDVPTELTGAGFRLEPLGPQHNESDYAAWTSSMEHIHATPGYEGKPWPHPMPAAENLNDVKGHAKDFADRTGFTYTVLEGDGEVIGCVYIYPAKPGGGADVHSWVRADRAGLDVPLHDAVSSWLMNIWPFETVSYAPRQPLV